MTAGRVAFNLYKLIRGSLASYRTPTTTPQPFAREVPAMWDKGLKDRLPELAGACYCIAAADDDPSETEMESVAKAIQLFAEKEVDRLEIDRLVEDAAAEVRAKGAQNYLVGLGDRIENEAARSQLLGAAASTLLADPSISDKEQQMFLQLAHALNISDIEAEFILNSVRAPLLR
jgi:uncharacterized tellurite resistance protein B-like protein